MKKMCIDCNKTCPAKEKQEAVCMIEGCKMLVKACKMAKANNFSPIESPVDWIYGWWLGLAMAPTVEAKYNHKKAKAPNGARGVGFAAAGRYKVLRPVKYMLT